MGDESLNLEEILCGSVDDTDDSCGNVKSVR